MDTRKRVMRSLPQSCEEYRTKRDSAGRRSTPLCPPLAKLTKRTPQKFLIQEHCSPKPVFYVKCKPLSRLYNSDNTESYFEQVFTKSVKIGEGSFGEVYRVQSKEDSRTYAVKQFKTNHHVKYAYAEVQNNEKVGEHENFVKFFLAWEELRVIHIQMEYCRISLAQYSEFTHDIDENQLWEVLYDMLKALEHLHKKNLIHLDVKPDNIMMSNGFYKLADFGLLADLNEHDGKKISTISDGDAKYLACEVLDGAYTYACDIFGLGISVLELATNIDLPEFGPLWHQIRQQLPLSLYRVASAEFAATLEQMMLFSYSDRPSATNLLKCPGLKQVKKRDKKGSRTDHSMNVPDVQETCSSLLLGQILDHDNLIETPRRPLNEIRNLSHSGHLSDRLLSNPEDGPPTSLRGLRIKLTF